MSRAGRRRNHQLKRKGIAIVSQVETIPTPNQVARRMPHRRLAAAEHAHDEKFETPLGTLYVLGCISRGLYVAGLQYARAVRIYRANVSAPRGVDKPGRGKGEFEPASISAAVADINPIVKALKSAGKRAADVTHRVIVEEAGIPPGGFCALLEGLGALAAHFKQRHDRHVTPNI